MCQHWFWRYLRLFKAHGARKDLLVVTLSNKNCWIIYLKHVDVFSHNSTISLDIWYFFALPLHAEQYVLYLSTDYISQSFTL